MALGRVNVGGSKKATGNAVESDVLLSKTFSNASGVGKTGTMPILGATIYNPSTGDQTIAAGRYLSGAQTIKAIVGTAAVGDVLYGKTFNSATAGVGKTGTIPSKAAATITPGTANQTIASGQYLSGTQTIEGSANLVAGNIKKDVGIFNVVGTYAGELRPDFTFEDLSNFPINYIDLNASGSNFTYTLPSNATWFLVDVISSRSEKTTSSTLKYIRARTKSGQTIMPLYSIDNDGESEFPISERGFIMSNYGGDDEINSIFISSGVNVRVYYIDISILGIKSIGVSANTTASYTSLLYNIIITGGMLYTTGTSSNYTGTLICRGTTELSEQYTITTARLSVRNSVQINKLLIPISSDESIAAVRSSTSPCTFWGRTFNEDKYTIEKFADTGDIAYLDYILQPGYKYFGVNASIEGGASNTTSVNIGMDDGYPVTQHDTGFLRIKTSGFLLPGTHIVFRISAGPTKRWRLSMLRESAI